jgi:hypothetical protein
VTTHNKTHRAEQRELLNRPRLAPLPDDRVYCYADCRGLTYPHYRAEHDEDHDAAHRLRAEHAGGTR